jgi:rhodanese-related sulfurtransferase
VCVLAAPLNRRFFGQYEGMMGTTDNPGGMAANATPDELAAALPQAVIVDVRGPDEVAKGPAVPGSLNVPWDRDADAMPLDGLPEDRSVPIFTH